MAATIAIARGVDTSRCKEVTRLGHKYAEVEANTWETFARITTAKDGSGEFTIRRGSQSLIIRWNPESEGLEIIEAKANFPWPICENLNCPR